MPSAAFPASGTPAFSLKSLLFETFVCSMAMTAFAALAGPIARVNGMVAWRSGAVALVADHLPVSERPKVRAALGAACALGIVIDPATAGLLAGGEPALPRFLIGVVPTIGLVMLRRVLPRRERHVPPVPARLSLFDPRLRHAMLTAFLAMASVSIAQAIVGFYAIDRLALSPPDGALTAAATRQSA